MTDAVEAKSWPISCLEMQVPLCFPIKKAGLFSVPAVKSFSPSWGSSKASHGKTGDGMEVPTPTGQL